jgi:hypothetical protein
MAEVSRRAILAAAGGLAGLAAVGFDGGAAATVPGSTILRSNYVKAVGQVFTATHAGHRHRLRLAAVRDLEPTTAAQRPHCFNLIFAPAGSTRLDDAIYVLRRPGVHTHRLFLSSLGTDGALQAVVNRLA